MHACMMTTPVMAPIPATGALSKRDAVLRRSSTQCTPLKSRSACATSVRRRIVGIWQRLQASRTRAPVCTRRLMHSDSASHNSAQQRITAHRAEQRVAPASLDGYWSYAVAGAAVLSFKAGGVRNGGGGCSTTSRLALPCGGCSMTSCVATGRGRRGSCFATSLSVLLLSAACDSLPLHSA